MSDQLQRLEALLERIQQNRGGTSAGGGAAPVQAIAAAKPRVEPAVSARPASTSGAPRAKAAPTPLELALEGRASRLTPQQPVPKPAVAAPVAPAAPARPAPAAPARAAAQPAPAAPAAPAPAPARAQVYQNAPAPAPAPVREGRVLAEPTVAEPTKPIAQVLSKQPPIAALTFGELLRRSLSLRPR